MPSSLALNLGQFEAIVAQDHAGLASRAAQIGGCLYCSELWLQFSKGNTQSNNGCVFLGSCLSLLPALFLITPWLAAQLEAAYLVLLFL